MKDNYEQKHQQEEENEEELEIELKPKKKKNPLTFNTYGVAFQEKIHCMFMNII